MAPLGEGGTGFGALVLGGRGGFGMPGLLGDGGTGLGMAPLGERGTGLGMPRLLGDDGTLVLGGGLGMARLLGDEGTGWTGLPGSRAAGSSDSTSHSPFGSRGTVSENDFVQPGHWGV